MGGLKNKFFVNFQPLLRLLLFVVCRNAYVRIEFYFVAMPTGEIPIQWPSLWSQWNVFRILVANTSPQIPTTGAKAHR
jgi:hypothetical protein